MLCDDCNIRKATMHMTKIVNGQKQETYLCEECGRKNKGITLEDNFSIHNFLSSLLEGNTIASGNKDHNRSVKCPQCGYTYKDFKERGRLGCDLCYDVFEEILSPLIRRVQGHREHIGKVPEKHGGIIKLKKQINDLKDSLKELIIKEKFEEAAMVRDYILELKSEIDSIQEG